MFWRNPADRVGLRLRAGRIPGGELQESNVKTRIGVTGRQHVVGLEGHGREESHRIGFAFLVESHDAIEQARGALVRGHPADVPSTGGRAGERSGGLRRRTTQHEQGHNDAHSRARRCPGYRDGPHIIASAGRPDRASALVAEPGIALELGAAGVAGSHE